MKRSAIRRFVAVLALAVSVSIGGTAASGAAGPFAHLEAHGKVVWLRIDSQTGEVSDVRESMVNVTALDTCPTIECVDRVFASFDTAPRGNVDDGPYVGFSVVNGVGYIDGLNLGFVDGGRPGTAPSGPTNSAGITPTVDYIYVGGTSPSYQLRAYFLTGGIEITPA